MDTSNLRSKVYITYADENGVHPIRECYEV